MNSLRVIAICLLVVGCNSEIYLRDGVTDGDTFYLAERALSDDDPVLQSWVSYSLSLSACKLAAGGVNPARIDLFECELLARRHLAETWNEQRTDSSDPYLDVLLQVYQARWLREYVATSLSRKHWVLPDDLDLPAYRAFARTNLRQHRPVTRLIGSWNFARNVRPAH